MVVEDHDIFVAATAGDGETAGLVRVDVACGLGEFGADGDDGGESVIGGEAIGDGWFGAELDGGLWKRGWLRGSLVFALLV